MAQLLIRDIKPTIIARLKVRAKEHHRSLQGELKSIVEAAVNKMSVTEARELSALWRGRLAGQSFSDSAKLLREDRDK